MLALIFPGQGSQAVGMGRALAAASPAARAVFDEADAALGEPLSALCFEGPADALKLTENAQPAILATSVAALRALEEAAGPLRPAAVAGHSLGEFTALVAAGALALGDAVRLVRARGRFMQEAVPPGEGGMAAVMGLDPAGVEALCAEAAEGEPLSPANFNGGGQVVVAGAAGAVKRLLGLARARRARAVPLRVSAPFHCALMAPAAERLAALLDGVPLAPPRVPVVTNVEAEPTRDPERIRALLVRQVTAPVLWEASVRRLAALGVARALEVGPGRVLAGLVRRIAPGIEVRGVATPEEVAAAAAAAGGGERDEPA